MGAKSFPVPMQCLATKWPANSLKGRSTCAVCAGGCHLFSTEFPAKQGNKPDLTGAETRAQLGRVVGAWWRKRARHQDGLVGAVAGNSGGWVTGRRGEQSVSGAWRADSRSNFRSSLQGITPRHVPAFRPGRRRGAVFRIK